MPFGQFVIGPPGSGKTTYCNGMSQFLGLINRKTIVVNLDPANDFVPYECAIDIRELVTLMDVMETYNLGPNGGLVFCIEYLEKNMDWLKEQLDKYKEYYVIFDCPGQVELYTHHESMRKIMEQLEKWSYRMTAVHLVDAHYCSEPSKFISVLLVSLSTMLQLEMPHVNVLSKIDLIEQYGKLDFNLDFYTDVQDLSYLLRVLDKDPFAKKYTKLNQALIDIIQDFGMVSFTTLNIEDKESVYDLLKIIDKSNGYIFGAMELHQKIFEYSMTQTSWDAERIQPIQERYMHDDVVEKTREEAEKLKRKKKRQGRSSSNNNNVEEEEEEDFDAYWDKLQKQLEAEQQMKRRQQQE